MTNDPIKLGGKARWLELAKLGRNAWNTWADSELKKPAEQRATVKLGGREIAHTNWGGFKFPGPAHFNNATFLGEADFAKTQFFTLAWFAGSTFPKSSSATFQDANFLGRADFSNCTFDGLGFFNSAHFESDASFNGSRFKGFAHFYSAVFKDAVDFCRASFGDNAGFGNTVFSADARFLNANFHSTKPTLMARLDSMVRGLTRLYYKQFQTWAVIPGYDF
jgi:uncharacterized protein YjbI with pentapeptide repeats